MLTGLENRFADVLGSRLPAPFAGRVRRRGAAAPVGDGPVVRIGVDAIEPLQPDFGSVRPEVVAGSADQRRIVRLRVSLGIEIAPQNPGDRLQALLGIDAVVYELQHPDMRAAALLVQPADQGFLVESLQLGTSPVDVASRLVAHIEGWFWPVGVVGQTGRAIERALVREFRLPVRLEIDGPLEAGGPGVALRVSFGTTGTSAVTRDGTTAAPFGEVALRLLDDGGGPGAGSLSGGQDGPEGTLRVVVTGGMAAATYTPSDQAVTDHLVVAAFTRDADGEQRIGIELARFDLVVVP